MRLSFRTTFYTAFVLAIHFQSFAQNIDFGNVNENQLDSSSYTVTNNQEEPIEYRVIFPYRFYNSAPFFSKDTLFTLQPGTTKTIRFYCRIQHNTLQNGEWILTTNHKSGDATADMRVQGKYTRTYYNSTENQAEEGLKTALKAIISNNPNSLGYNNARDEMYGDIDNVNDSVTCIYTNRKAKFNTRSGASSNNFNCEHTFPQGYFGSANPMVSDLHHLFSTDENANNSRGNLAFGVATAPYEQPTWNFPSLKGANNLYEPQNSHKGNCARAMMYFVLRYQDYTNFFAPQQATLKQWHNQFPPTAKDKGRNEKVFLLQTNRNPFIDYPQFSDRITNLVQTSTPAAITHLSVSRPVFSFSDIALGAGFNSTIAVWNDGNQPLQILGLSFANNICQGVDFPLVPFQLAPGEGRNFTFAVPANSAGDLIDSLRITTSLPSASVVVPINGIVISTDQYLPALSLRILPNPTQAFISIQGISVSQKANIQVTNAVGRKQNLEHIDGKIDVSQLSTGVYHIRLYQDGRFYRSQFVKY